MVENIEEEGRRKDIQRKNILKKFLRVTRNRKMRRIVIMKALLKILRLTVKKMLKKELKERRGKETNRKRKKKLE
jgi:hypothetical protein